MLEILKKIIALAAAIAVLLLLMYVAFYLFVIALVCIIGIAIYAKIKGLTMQDFQHKASHYSRRGHNKPDKGETTSKETIIIESVEYRDITPKDR